MATTWHLLVGTFDVPAIYTLAFTSNLTTSPRTYSLSVVHTSEASGPHSWLALSEDGTRLYTTTWTSPPSLSSYALSKTSSTPTLTHLNSVPTVSRSGYVCASSTTLYSAGGATGEVYRLDSQTGSIGRETQKLDFREGEQQIDRGGVMDFGGLRHGAHSADLSPDGKILYVADLGRNCIFVYKVLEDGTLELTDKSIAIRSNDAPRHVTPHPNGKYVYSLQEHSSMVDIFSITEGKLTHVSGVKIIPSQLSCSLFWADEVRVSPSSQFLYASTRGLVPSQNGWVAAFELNEDGRWKSEEPVGMWETPTSGGWANAIQPAPYPLSNLRDGEGKDYIALTDSEEGLVMILSWDGQSFEEVCRTKVEGGAATAVWIM